MAPISALLQSALALLMAAQGATAGVAAREHAVAVASQALSEANRIINSQSIPTAFEGRAGCLPSRAGTDECVIGLLTADGTYYGLESWRINVRQFVAGAKRIQVGGALKTQNYTGWESQLAERYGIKGIIVVKKLTALY